MRQTGKFGLFYQKIKKIETYCTENKLNISQQEKIKLLAYLNSSENNTIESGIQLIKI